MEEVISELTEEEPERQGAEGGGHQLLEGEGHVAGEVGQGEGAGRGHHRRGHRSGQLGGRGHRGGRGEAQRRQRHQARGLGGGGGEQHQRGLGPDDEVLRLVVNRHGAAPLPQVSTITAAHCKHSHQ